MSKKFKVENTERLLELNDEKKIRCAVRAISGESVLNLALEYGVSEDVIKAWVDRVSDMVEDKNIDRDEDLEKKIASAKALCYRLQKQIESRKKQIEMRETELRMLKECPPFMRGGGRR